MGAEIRTDEDTARENLYWQANLRLIGILLLVWFAVSFVLIYFARPLAEVRFLGWPFSFFMAAQGSLIVFIVIVWVYARRMRRLDEQYRGRDGDS